MTKLNQIIAVEKGVKSKSLQDITAAHHKVQKPALLAGISRTYQPKDEEGEQLPPESARVQFKAEEALREMSASLTRLFDVTATKDWANCSARADVTVDGRTVVAEVPVSYLLFLEKQLTDLHTFVKNFPSWTPPSPGRSTPRRTGGRRSRSAPSERRRSRVTTSRPRRPRSTRRRSTCTTRTCRSVTGRP